VRILLWHGWLLDGSGSNVAAARLAEAWRREGHDVVLVCQERHPERHPFIDAWGTADGSGVSVVLDRRPRSLRAGSGRVTLLRPEIGRLLPVFVLDEYEGHDAKRFVDLTDAELAGYIDANVKALAAVAGWMPPDAVVVGHAVAGPAIARRALAPGAYIAKLHGSDLEYAVRLQARYRDLASEGLSAARAVVGASLDVLDRAAELVSSLPDRLQVVAPGVDVTAFRPLPRRRALGMAAALLATDPAIRRGRTATAASYDQDAPDRDAPDVLEGLARRRGPMVGYLGKLIPAKGVDLLLEALALVPSPTRGLVVGFGSGREDLETLCDAIDAGSTERAALLVSSQVGGLELSPSELVAARGLRGRISFTGRLDHRYAPLVLAAVDVLVVPSILEEAFGMVAIEGAAAGALPLVARHSGLAEVAAALEGAVGRPGLFSYRPGPGSAHRIAEGIRALLSIDRTERLHLRRRVSSFARAEWTWARSADRLLSVAASLAPPAP
jgi:glycosyltransferase involved in cell wall biosynthesis